MYFVYVLRSLKNRKSYVGRTSKLPGKRLYEHNTGGTQWTKQNRPLELIYYESYHCRADAINREQFLKSGLGNKLVTLIKDHFNSCYVAGSVSPTGRSPRGRG